MLRKVDPRESARDIGHLREDGKYNKGLYAPAPHGPCSSCMMSTNKAVIDDSDCHSDDNIGIEDGQPAVV